MGNLLTPHGNSSSVYAYQSRDRYVEDCTGRALMHT